MSFDVARNEKGYQVFNGRNRIESVAILEGDGPEANSPVRQYVSLPKDPKWIDDIQIPDSKIRNIDRLGRKLRGKVRFQLPGKEKFSFQLIFGWDELKYSNEEKGENPNYCYDPENWVDGETEADGTKIIEVTLSAAGGQTFRIVAKDICGAEVISKDIVVWRRLFVQEIKMKKNGTVIGLSNIDGFKREMDKRFVEVVQLKAIEMEFRPYEVSNDFLDAIRQAYRNKESKAPKREPYVVAIAYVDQMGERDRVDLKEYPAKGLIRVGPKSPDVEIPIIDRTGKRRFLWMEKDQYTGEDWFYNGNFVSTNKVEAKIRREDCTPLPVNSTKCDKIRVRVANLSPKTNSGKIHLEVRVVHNMAGGEIAGDRWKGDSFGSGQTTNLIFLPSLAWWQKIPVGDSIHDLLHEVGHMIGMVPDGAGDLEKVPTNYSGRGHAGSHCHAGLPLKNEFEEKDISGSKCIMFGASNQTLSFCSNCSKAVKKIDLGKGWPSF
ncbi:MAG: hypothetical protein QME90_06620 [Thermodesulfobacteriota bacterium]|nr:hypothetical protein [Thermodesulfobacteriota bacterium]